MSVQWQLLIEICTPTHAENSIPLSRIHAQALKTDLALRSGLLLFILTYPSLRNASYLKISFLEPKMVLLLQRKLNDSIAIAEAMAGFAESLNDQNLG